MPGRFDKRINDVSEKEVLITLAKDSLCRVPFTKVEGNQTIFEARALPTKEDIFVLKITALKDIDFELPTENPHIPPDMFKLKNHRGEEVSFSYRNSKAKEMRGQLLIDFLKKEREKNPKGTVYDVLTEVLRQNSDVILNFKSVASSSGTGTPPLMKPGHADLFTAVLMSLLKEKIKKEHIETSEEILKDDPAERERIWERIDIDKVFDKTLELETRLQALKAQNKVLFEKFKPLMDDFVAGKINLNDFTQRADNLLAKQGQTARYLLEGVKELPSAYEPKPPPTNRDRLIDLAKVFITPVPFLGIEKDKTLFDREFFPTQAELDFLQRTKLEDMVFENIEKDTLDKPNPIFLIKSAKEEGPGVRFSNRDPNANELRAQHLRDYLEKMKQSNPQQSVYEALRSGQNNVHLEIERHIKPTVADNEMTSKEHADIYFATLSNLFREKIKQEQIVSTEMMVKRPTERDRIWKGIDIGKVHDDSLALAKAVTQLEAENPALATQFKSVLKDFVAEEINLSEFIQRAKNVLQNQDPAASRVLEAVRTLDPIETLKAQKQKYPAYIDSLAHLQACAAEASTIKDQATIHPEAVGAAGELAKKLSELSSAFSNKIGPRNMQNRVSISKSRENFDKACEEYFREASAAVKEFEPKITKEPPGKMDKLKSAINQFLDKHQSKITGRFQVSDAQKFINLKEALQKAKDMAKEVPSPDPTPNGPAFGRL